MSASPSPDAPGRRRAPRGWSLVGLVAAAVAIVGVLLYAFQPWALWTTTVVDEALPTAPASAPARSPSSAPSAAVSADPAAGSTSTAPAAAGPAVVASGTFRSYEHETTGTASLVKVGEAYVVRLTDFATSNGPDVKVWLTRAGVGAADGSRDAGYIALGDLKGNRGNQNYPVPTGTDVDAYPTVVVWCDRFSVAFGAAWLRAV